MSEGKQQVKEQKQDGQTRFTKQIMGNLFKSPHVVLLVAKQILLISMLIAKGVGQISIVVNVAKNNVWNGGMQNLKLIGRLLGHTNMALRQKILKTCTNPSKANAQYVVPNPKQNVGFMLTMTTILVKLEDFFATVAMWPWVLLRKM